MLVRGAAGRLDESRETKVRNLNLAVAIDEDVARLHVSVKDFAVVEILERLEQLVDNIPPVHRRENFRADCRVQVGFHILEDKIKVAAVGWRRPHHVEERDDGVVVCEFVQKDHFAIRAL